MDITDQDDARTVRSSIRLCPFNIALHYAAAVIIVEVISDEPTTAVRSWFWELSYLKNKQLFCKSAI